MNKEEYYTVILTTYMSLFGKILSLNPLVHIHWFWMENNIRSYRFGTPWGWVDDAKKFEWFLKCYYLILISLEAIINMKAFNKIHRHTNCKMQVNESPISILLTVCEALRSKHVFVLFWYTVHCFKNVTTRCLASVYLHMCTSLTMPTFYVFN